MANRWSGRAPNFRRLRMEALEKRELLSAAPAAGTWSGTLVDDSSGNLFTVDVANQLATKYIGSTSQLMNDIACSTAGSLYGVSQTNNGYSQLFSIPTNFQPATTSVLMITPKTVGNVTVGGVRVVLDSLEFRSDGALFGAGFDANGNSAVYSINTGTGLATQMISLGGQLPSGDLTFDSSGNMYIATANATLLRIDPAFKTVTLVGSLPATDFFGMSYGPGPEMYGYRSNQVWRINPTSAASTFLGTVPVEGTIWGATTIFRPPIVLGATDSRTVVNQMPVLGQLWYQVVASHNAILTTDVLNAAPNSGVTVSVFQQNPDTTLKTLASGQQRLDYTATAGQVYYVEVSGVTGATEVRFTNLVALAGNGATVFDTAGNDTFQFTPPSSLTKNYTLVIDGESYQFPFSSSSQVSVTFAGTAGRDVAQLSGSAANDTFVLNLATHSGALTSAAYRVSVSGTDEIDVQGGGGADTATLTGTASADKLTLAPGSATLVSGANQVQATGATSIVVNTGGGGDTAVYTGFSASETVTLRPNTLDVIAGGMTLHASGLATISATAGAGGAQTAILYGSPGNDTFSSTPVSATLSGSGYSNTVNAFPSVTAIGDGGSDTANLADAPGATVAFNGSPTTDSLAGTLASGAAFSETLSGFASVVAKANPGLGIHDQANFTDSGQNVQLVAAGNTAQLSNAAHSFVCQAIGFNFVVATASPTSLDTKHVTPPLGFVLTTVGPWVSI